MYQCRNTISTSVRESCQSAFMSAKGLGCPIGAGMKTEDGDWDDPADRRIMQTWDPYFNIKAGVSYPRMLVVVATTDN
jgi:hypothetical protein